MPVLKHDEGESTSLAVIAESLFLINLLLLPVLAFVLLLFVYWKFHGQTNVVNRNHLQQTVTASLWGGFLLVVINALILLLGGYQGAYTWMIVVLYFTIVHSTFILLGIFGLVKALSGECWKYPLVGRPKPDGC